MPITKDGTGFVNNQKIPATNQILYGKNMPMPSLTSAMKKLAFAKDFIKEQMVGLVIQ